ncbi:MAG: aminoacetone oxidase family FAD-binding enzyme [Abitibacteriaceae bacterium]|nr:aminoacetone oxidase family FAD-binding enzyme [Abditibacteriaceae bacterium]
MTNIVPALAFSGPQDGCCRLRKLTFMEQVDVVIVGAGAAGLMAAIAAGERGAQVIVLDSQQKIGAKILVAGGGRCNVTNEYVDASRFHGGSSSFIGRVLRAFNMEATHRFFERIGVQLKLEETGKYFPVTDSSRTVLNALLNVVGQAGANLVTEQPVTDIRPRPSTQERDAAAVEWEVQTPSNVWRAKAVVLCTGGLALPKSGSNGAGYGFATRLGHTLVPTTPALTPLLATPTLHAGLSGITLPVRLQLKNGANKLAEYSNSFLFTHVGYSGPAALNLSRHVARERWMHPQAQVGLRLLPQVADGEEGRFWQELVRRESKKSVVNVIAELLPRRVAETVLTEAKVPPAVALGKLSPQQQTGVRQALLDSPLPVSEVAGYTKAEATAGGISLDEIEPATMMSRLVPGLFFAGEIMDVDGWLGGYNFQWAWSSGTVAGRAAARFAARA